MDAPVPVDASAHARQARYTRVCEELDAWLEPGADATAAMATAAALLYRAFAYFDWVGFYRLDAHGDLVVGPYQGPVACTHIPRGRGVCGACAERGKPIVVPDVARFDGYIACSAATRSEVVVPVTVAGRLVAVADADSDSPGAFIEADAKGMEWICRVVARHWQSPNPSPA